MQYLPKFNINFNQFALVTMYRNLAALIPLTMRGSIALILAAGALSIYGYGFLDLVVFSLAICALTILVFCLFCCVGSGLFIVRRIQQELKSSESIALSINVEAGFPNETGIALPAINFSPLVRLSWKIVSPDYIKTRIRISPTNELVEEIIPQKRCLTDVIIRQFTVSDVLGFCSYSWRLKQHIGCRILPRTNTVKPLPLLRSLTAEDGIPSPTGEPEGDRMEIRPYTPGDSIRNIMWKVYARNRQLNVRLAEKSVFQSKRTIAYLISSEHDEAAAAVARVALEGGAMGEDWTFGADGSEQPCTTLESALDAIAKSRAIGPPYSYGLDNFLAATPNKSAGHCIIFAAANTGPWLPQMKKTIGRLSSQFSLVLATDGFQDREASNLWRKLFYHERPNTHDSFDATCSKRDLLNLLTQLGQLVESTVVVDRKTGYSFDHDLRKV